MAATTESFSAMLKRYQPFKLHMELLKRHNWFVNWVQKKQDFYGGTMEVPLEAGQAASFQWGALTASNDIGEDNFLMGTLTNSDLKELWGTMLFNEKDMRRHGNMERSYLKILPNRLNRFTELMSQMVSVTFFGDGSIDQATADGESDGEITVNYPHRFSIGMKVRVDDDNSSAVTGYVTAIDVNTKKIKLQNARTSGSDVNLTGYTVAQNAKIYLPGESDIPSSLQNILLSASNGGGSSYYGFTKATYPALQALNIDGSSFTQATLLDDLYSAYYEALDQGKGSMKKIMVMPFKFLQYISAGLENNRRYTMETKNVSYGMRAVNIIGPDGEAEFIFIRDCDPTVSYILDKSAVYLCGNNFFRRHKDPNGNEFFTSRATTGYNYIVDTCFEAALAVMPSHNAIVHSIPNPLV